MATVRWGDNVVVTDGIDKDSNILNSVVMYNVKTEHAKSLAAANEM
jgi:hypothetical protein